MRAYLTFTAEKTITLPIHHNHILQAFIYNSFADETFAKFLHEQGYKWKKRNFKLFSFSRLQGEMNMDHDKKVISFKPPVTLVISSIKDIIIEDLITNIIKKDYLHLAHQEIFLDEVRIKNYNFNQQGRSGQDRVEQNQNMKEIDKTDNNKADKNAVKEREENDGNNSYIIKFLSPVTAYRTEIENGSKKTIYFQPWEKEFQSLLKTNLLKKYEIIHNKQINKGKFTITPQFENGEKKFTIIIFKGFVIKGWTGQFVISGDSELLQIGYDSGLGAKNSMGHGLFEVVEERNC